MTESKNIIYRSKQEFEQLPDDVRMQFKNHLEFLKFIDNPQNVEKMLKLGILTKRQIDAVQISDDPLNSTTTTKTQDEKKEDKK